MGTWMRGIRDFVRGARRAAVRTAWLFGVLALVTSCRRPSPAYDRDAVDDLLVLCDAEYSTGVWGSSDRTLAKAAEVWLPTQTGRLKTARAQRLVAELAAQHDVEEKAAALRSEAATVGLSDCRLLATYEALASRSPYQRDLGAICDGSWADVKLGKLLDGSTPESPAGAALLARMTARMTAPPPETARATLNDAIEHAGSVPYKERGAVLLSASTCPLLRQPNPDEPLPQAACEAAAFGMVNVIGNCDAGAATGPKRP
jgi:hypothetical protein